jgi:hypothetical protein
MEAGMKLSGTALQQRIDFGVPKSEEDETGRGRKAPAPESLKKLEHRFPDQFGFYPEADGVIIRREE